MIRFLIVQDILAMVLVMFASLAAHGEELASISTHSQRYGGGIEISAYDDPLLKGVTCYLSRTREESQFGNAQKNLIPQADASCHQVGTLIVSKHLPKQASVFEESLDPIFKTLHIFRVLDSSRMVVLYFVYTESELAGDLPGHVDVIRLPARGRQSAD